MKSLLSLLVVCAVAVGCSSAPKAKVEAPKVVAPKVEAPKVVAPKVEILK